MLGTLAVGGSFVAMRSEAFEEHERALAVRVRRPRGRLVDSVVSAATDLGSTFAVTGAAAILLASRRPRAAIDVVGSGATAWTVAQIVKPIVARPRPYEVEDAFRLVSEPAGSSWPSGHPAVAAAAAATLAPRLPRRGRLVGALLAAFVATSRVYVGVHYPTDVIAGLGIGVLCGEIWRAALDLVKGPESPERQPGD